MNEAYMWNLFEASSGFSSARAMCENELKNEFKKKKDFSAKQYKEWTNKEVSVYVRPHFSKISRRL